MERIIKYTDNDIIICAVDDCDNAATYVVPVQDGEYVCGQCRARLHSALNLQKIFAEKGVSNKLLMSAALESMSHTYKTR